ncbi:DMT family transporter [Desnuesiella massiliensis]|uniref:DMT family transporter n=1 Tax=Desnuesiella massiliensis TaxID=1650662 RepID=UPI0006E265EF|nr:DMT family transporter [Desnuesiella massiliensis]
MFYILIAVLAGASIVIGRIINYKLAEEIGLFQGTLVNYIVGLVFAIIFLLVSGESIVGLQISAVPWWAYLGGITGVIVVVLSSYITPKISSFYLALIVFIGQLFVGIIIDSFSLKSIPVGKIVGGILVLGGLTYNLMLDRTASKEEMNRIAE